MSKIAVILTEGFADWEYALIAGAGGPFYGLDVRFFASESGEVRSQGGLVAVVADKVDAILEWPPQAVVVVGGSIWTTEDAPDIGALLGVHHENGGVVAGICGGTLALARAGLLDAKVHTSNDQEFLGQYAEGYAGAGSFRQSASAVSADRVITASGTAPVSFTAAIFESVGLDQDAVQQFKNVLAAEHA